VNYVLLVKKVNCDQLAIEKLRNQTKALTVEKLEESLPNMNVTLVSTDAKRMLLQGLKQWASTIRLMLTLRKRGASDKALSMLVVSTDEFLQRKRTDKEFTEP
jgi:hypothetical protein